VYVVAVAFTNAPRFLSQAIGLVAYPHLAAQPAGGRAGRTILRFMVLGVVLCGLTAAIIEVALPWLVPALFGRSFAPAIGIARVLLLSAVLVSVRRLLSDCARGAGFPGIGSASEIVALGLFPPAALLIGGGATGVAWALVVSGGAAVAVVLPRVLSALRRHRRAGPSGSSGLGYTDVVEPSSAAAWNH
jgi:O-antigen/teichoic acid export membrane protein